MKVLGPSSARLTLAEGSYHQVRRMFAAVGNHVDALHRNRIGGLVIIGAWRVLDAAESARLFATQIDGREPPVR